MPFILHEHPILTNYLSIYNSNGSMTGVDRNALRTASSHLSEGRCNSVLSIVLSMLKSANAKWLSINNETFTKYACTDWTGKNALATSQTPSYGNNNSWPLFWTNDQMRKCMLCPFESLTVNLTRTSWAKAKLKLSINSSFNQQKMFPLQWKPLSRCLKPFD